MEESLHKHEGIQVRSQFSDYSVEFCRSIDEALVSASANQTSSYLVVDSYFQTHPSALLGGLVNRIFWIDASEENKTLTTVQLVCQWLLDQGASKSSRLIAIGGGMTQDIATFVSGTYYRGIEWCFIPTTLLSMSDSCVGGKCALNQGGFKNQIGLIWPPRQILIVSSLLESLPIGEVESGFGEILKLSLTGPENFFNDFVRTLENKQFSLDDIENLILRSLKAKIAVVEVDEIETDLRRILNYGHTFGHALEAATKHEITHGSAIVLGMDLVNFIGVELGIVPRRFFQEFRKLCEVHFNLHELRKIAHQHIDELFELVSRDKKRIGGSINFAFARGAGDLFVSSVAIDEDLRDIVKAYFIGSS